MNKKEEKTKMPLLLKEIEKAMKKIMENVPEYFYAKMWISNDTLSGEYVKTFRGKKQ